MFFTFIFCVFHFFAKSPQADKEFGSQKSGDSRIISPVDNQHWRLDSVEIERRGILYISFSKLPRTSPHLPLTHLQASCSIRCTIFSHFPVLVDQISHSSRFYR